MMPLHQETHGALGRNDLLAAMLSFGRSKSGRSKLGRNGDSSGTSAPIRLKKVKQKKKMIPQES